MRIHDNKLLGLAFCMPVFFGLMLFSGFVHAQEYSQLEIWPPNVGVFASQETQQFRALGTPVGGGDRVDISTEVDWVVEANPFPGQELEPDEIATIDENGLLTIVNDWGRVNVTVIYPKRCHATATAINGAQPKVAEQAVECGSKVTFRFGPADTAGDVASLDAADTCSGNLIELGDGTWDYVIESLHTSCDAVVAFVPGVPPACASCDPQARCVEEDGAYGCVCKAGYVGDGESCSYVCSVCDVNATCDETGETARCLCNDGFTGDGFTCVSSCPSCNDAGSSDAAEAAPANGQEASGDDGGCSVQVVGHDPRGIAIILAALSLLALRRRRRLTGRD